MKQSELRYLIRESLKEIIGEEENQNSNITYTLITKEGEVIKPKVKNEIQKITTETPKSAAFLSATLILFLYLDKPVSIHIKPACIMKTKIAQSITHKVSILLVSVSITF